MARAARFNEQNENHFFNLLEKLVDNLDGHTTHSKNLNAILLAREHGVVLLQLPGRTTNRLQPLDVSLFKPMENYSIKAVERFLRTNPGVPVSQYNMTPLLNEAYANAASIATIQNGFRRAGIWPVDRAVFSQADFVPAALLLETTPPLVSQSTSLTSSNTGNIQTSVDIEVDPADWYCFMCEDNVIEDMV
nr:unnamed protein product [Callosobruchus analis]